MISRSVSLILLIFLLSCSGAKNAVVEQTIVDTSVPSPEILFLNFSIYKDQESVVTVDQVNTIVAKGKIKVRSHHHSTSNNTEYLCVQYDQKSKPLDSLILDNPFLKDVEYMNSKGEFERKRIELDSTQVSLRLQLADRAHSIAIVHDNQIISKIKL